MIKLFIWLVHAVALSTMPQSTLVTTREGYAQNVLNELVTEVVYESSGDCNNFKTGEISLRLP
ncbi:hypothetical protein [Leeuwenhoekiella sp. MAR_2009_132]|uniref:hypothetical protein n=1 Tax=Leeuwenhoekiella sp. MAR_2009_132 TaxID=1392489 RepID=UPI00048CD0F2|nr:hypothetical protein [Leeuwenhoekiella sp. MAR_2009_132]